MLAAVKMLETIVDKNERVELGDRLGFALMPMLGAMNGRGGKAKVSEVVQTVRSEFFGDNRHDMDLVSFALEVANRADSSRKRLDIGPAARLGECFPNFADLLASDSKSLVKSVGRIVARELAANNLLGAFAKFVDEVKDDAIGIQDDSFFHNKRLKNPIRKF